MSKKLIAVAAAAALALTGLVATPANATTITKVAITTNGAGTSTTNVDSHSSSTDAVTAATAMTSRTLDYTVSGTSTRNVVRFDVTTASAASLAISSTNGVKVTSTLVDGTGAALPITAGTTTLAGSTTAGVLTYTFYAFTTSTTAGAVVIDSGASKTTHYIKGTIYEPYNITSVTWPASLVSGSSTSKVTFKLTDPYGNEVSAAGAAITPTGFGATFAAATYSSTTKLWSSTITVGATADNVAINIALPDTTADLSANGFAKPVTSAFKLITAGDLATQVTALTAQVATLQASVAALTADYNSVAKKYNKLVKKSKRVALK
jgi:hypothetical protein